MALTLEEFVAECTDPDGPIGLPNEWNPSDEGCAADVDQLVQLAAQAGLLPPTTMLWDTNDGYFHVTVDVGANNALRLSSPSAEFGTIAGYASDTVEEAVRAIVSDMEVTVAGLLATLNMYIAESSEGAAMGATTTVVHMETGGMLDRIVTTLRTSGGVALETSDGELVEVVGFDDVGELLGGWTPREVTDPLPVALADALADRGYDADQVDAWFADGAENLPWQVLDMAENLFRSSGATKEEEAR